ncbi:RNA-directed DNA polymerase, eukaryota [Tanacetum coccineum]
MQMSNSFFNLSGNQESFNLLCQLVRGLVLSNIEDRWSWSLEGSGLFSVKSSRAYIDDLLLPKADAATRWIRILPIKINVFAWKVCLDALPTRCNMSLRGIDIPSILCPLCNRAVENSDHIFFSCSMVRKVWRRLLTWWELDVSSFHSYNEWISWLSSIRLPKLLKVFLEGSCYVMWWLVWKFRNRLLFSDPTSKPDSLFDDVVQMSFLWMNSRSKSRLNWISWLKSPMCIILVRAIGVMWGLIALRAFFGLGLLLDSVHSECLPREKELLDRVKDLERERDEWRETASDQVEKIRGLEKDLEPRTQQLVAAKEKVKVLEGEKQNLLGKVAQAEADRKKLVREFIYVVVKRLHTSVEYRKSLATPVQLYYTSRWLGGLSLGRTEDEIAQFLSKTQDLDTEVSKSWKSKHRDLFTTSYPYVQKVADSCDLPMNELLAVYPDVPPPTMTERPTSGVAVEDAAQPPPAFVSKISTDIPFGTAT